MHEQYSWPRSVTQFIFSLCEQAVSLQIGREGDGVSEGGGACVALNESQSNHCSIWMIWKSSVFLRLRHHIWSPAVEADVKALHTISELQVIRALHENMYVCSLIFFFPSIIPKMWL